MDFWIPISMDGRTQNDARMVLIVVFVACTLVLPEIIICDPLPYRRTHCREKKRLHIRSVKSNSLSVSGTLLTGMKTRSNYESVRLLRKWYNTRKPEELKCSTVSFCVTTGWAYYAATKTTVERTEEHRCAYCLRTMSPSTRQRNPITDEI